jgi:hypothetical protein
MNGERKPQIYKKPKPWQIKGSPAAKERMRKIREARKQKKAA